MGGRGVVEVVISLLEFRMGLVWSVYISDSRIGGLLAYRVSLDMFGS